MFAATDPVPKKPKIVVCHQRNNGTQTRAVQQKHLEDHLGHGDTLGACAGDADPHPFRSLIAVFDVNPDGTLSFLGQREIHSSLLARPIVTRDEILIAVPHPSGAHLRSVSLHQLDMPPTHKQPVSL